MSNTNKDFASIRKQVLSGSNRFQLIDTELCEALLYRSTRSFGTLSGRNIADLLFLHTMLIYVLAQEEVTQQYARDYAYHTIQYGTYSLFRTHATDIYLLAYTVLVDYSTQVKLKDHIDSRSFLDSLNFNRRHHVDFLRRISTGDDTPGVAVSYLYRLEAQLRLNNPRFKTLRRMAITWHTMDVKEKTRFYKTLNMEMMRLTYGGARNAELVKNGIKPLLSAASNADK